MMQNLLDGLTPQQQQAVTHLDGPMLVVAGAGSGKTRVVTRRIAWLIGQGVPPHQILAMTFTNKAAGEMRERVEQMVGQAPRWIGTFHSLCARFLRFDIEKLDEGRSAHYTIYDSGDQESLIKDISKDLHLDDKRFKPRTLGAGISKAKCEMKSPDDLHGGSYEDDVLIRVYKEYERRLRASDALDFDDLLTLTVRLLQQHAGVREDYRRRFRYLLIDEYQDTNHAQYRLMKLLCNEKNNVHVTGDPDQSIYSWRGADYRNIMDFQSDFPDARVVRLEQNYRSTQAILSAANAVIKHNSERIEKNLFTEGDAGRPVEVVTLDSDRFEGEWIAHRAAELKAGGRRYADMAILYRTNAQSRTLEEALMAAGIPYQIVGGIRFYERKEIKDLLAHLKILVNPRDEIALDRLVSCRPTGVGEKTLAAVRQQAAARGVSAFHFLASDGFAQAYEGRASTKLRDFSYWCGRLAKIALAPVDQCVKELIEASGLIVQISSAESKDPAWEDRLENIDAFLGRAVEFAGTHPEAALPEFLEDVALVADVDAYDPQADNLVLMTLHSAKGLEFPVVVLAGLENGLLPHSNSAGELKREEEERRLFYVGITRAREQLCITRARTRMLWGQFDYARPSPFLDELPEEEIREVEFEGNDFDESQTARPSVSRGGSRKNARSEKQFAPFEEDDSFDLGGGDDLFLDDDDDFGAAFDDDDFEGGASPHRPATKHKLRPSSAEDAPPWDDDAGTPVRPARPFETTGRPSARPAPGRNAGRSGPVRSATTIRPAGAPPIKAGGLAKMLAGSGTPFRAGDHVEHPSFGRGKVLSCSRSQAVVQFFDSGTRLIALGSVEMKKV